MKSPPAIPIPNPAIINIAVGWPSKFKGSPLIKVIMPKTSKFLKRTNCGNINARMGMIKVSKARKNKISIPLKRNLAKAYPAKAALNVAKIIIRPTWVKVVKRWGQNCITAQAVLKLSKETIEGTQIVPTVPNT